MADPPAQKTKRKISSDETESPVKKSSKKKKTVIESDDESSPVKTSGKKRRAVIESDDEEMESKPQVDLEERESLLNFALVKRQSSITL